MARRDYDRKWCGKHGFLLGSRVIRVRHFRLVYALLQHGILKWDIFLERILVKKLYSEIKICFSGLL